MKRWFFALLLLLSLSQLHADNIVKTVVDGEVINASDWNAEFLNIYADVTHSIAGTWTFTKSGTPITITPASAPAANTLVLDINNTSGTNLWSLDYEADTVRAGSETWTVSDSATVTSTTFSTQIHLSTGTAGTTFGLTNLFQLEDASGNTNDAAAVDVVWTDATHGSEDADFVVRLVRASSLTEGFRVKSTGSITVSTSYQIAGTSVLNAGTLGSGVTASSLTSLGTLTALNVGGLSTLTIADSATNAASDVVQVVHTTSGTATTAFGSRLAFYLEDASGNTNQAGQIDVVWADATDTSEDTDIVFRNMAAGVAVAEKFRFSSVGAITAAGSITSGSLTSGRVLTAGASGLITDSANLTYNGTTLSLTGGFVQPLASTSDTLIGGVLNLREFGGSGDIAYFDIGHPADGGPVSLQLRVLNGSSAEANSVLFAPGRVTFTDNITVSGTGTNAIGAAVNADYQFQIAGAFAGPGNTAGFVAPLYVGSTLTPAADREAATIFVNGLMTEAGSGTHDWMAGILVNNSVTAGAGATTLAAGLYALGTTAAASTGIGAQVAINGNATGATLNYSLYIASGTGVRWAGYGSGAATFDANGNITSVSDERMKNIDGPFNKGLNAALGIRPILYHYNEDSKLDTVNQYAGFSAQQVMKYIPEAVGKNPEGFYSIQDRTLTAVLFKAIQELSAEVDELRAAAGLSRQTRTVTENIGEAGIAISPPPPRIPDPIRRVR